MDVLVAICVVLGGIAALFAICAGIAAAWRRWKQRGQSPAVPVSAAITDPADAAPPPTSETPPTLPIFSVPYARNPNFTGRASLLKAVREALEGGEAAALTQAIVGLGGVGKTQLALEYAYRHRQDYKVVWWVRSEGPELAGDYGRLAVRLGLLKEEEAKQPELVAEAQRWLQQNSGWLLILDNAENPQAIYEYLPRGGDGHVIITSRSQAFGGVARAVEVPEFPRPESIAFLKKRTGQEEGADALAEEVGDLPLALEQAAAYVEATGCTLGDYVGLFRTSRETLWKNEKPPLGYTKTVGTTWAVAMKTLQEKEPAAAKLLNLLAFLAPDDIPRDLFAKGAEHLPDSLAEVVKDQLALNRAIAALRHYSLITADDDSLSLHRLVQHVTRDRLSDDERGKWAAAAVRLLNAAFPFKDDDPATWPGSGSLLPHVLAAAEHAADAEVELDAVGRLLNQAGLYLEVRAEFAAAKMAFRRALTIAEKTYAPDDRRVAIRVNNLGAVLHDMGDLAGAREHYERALAIDEKAYGPDHPTVAIRVNNLGRVLQAMGDLEGAREHLERTLAIDEEHYGCEHPNVAVGLRNLGAVLREQGKLGRAQHCLDQGLAIDEKAYGPDHPEVARTLNNLGLVMRDRCNFTLARDYCNRALAIYKKAFGPEHPYVADASYNLGMVFQDLGDVEGAREHFERALRIRIQVLGEDHPHTKLVRANLEALGKK